MSAPAGAAIIGGMESTETFQLSASVAEAYEATFVPAFFAQWAPHLLDAAGVGPGHRVLDVACGTGIVARGAFDRVGPSGTVVGVDANEAMLAVARRVQPRIEWRLGDAADLPVADSEFDVAVCQMAMMFFPDPVAALRELARAVGPGGTVGVLHPGRLDGADAYPAFVDIVSRHAGPEARRLVTSYFALGDLARTSGLFEQAGLTVTATASPVGIAQYPSIDAFTAAEIDSTPLGERLEPEVRARIEADTRAALARFAGPDGTAVIPIECHVIVATLHSG
jgi:ubiquinone/menaquinone biosynthesis C-methylase UbiE